MCALLPPLRPCASCARPRRACARAPCGCTRHACASADSPPCACCSRTGRHARAGPRRSAHWLHDHAAAPVRALAAMRVLLARCAARAFQPTFVGHLLRTGAWRSRVARASVPPPPFPTAP
eukprot:1876528-Pleurochrysis_carterae.AAC.1